MSRAEADRENCRRERDQRSSTSTPQRSLWVVLDTAGRIMRLNRKGASSLSVRQEQALGKDWFTEFVPIAPDKRRLTDLNGSLLEEINRSDALKAPCKQPREERDMEWHNATP